MDLQLQRIAKYNLWDGNGVNPGVARPLYTNRIAASCGNNLIKVLTGQRRVGKSYILRQVADRLVSLGVNPHNILIINKEYADYDSISSVESLHAFIQKYKKELNVAGRYYIFIDEVQDIAGWEHVVNSYSQDYTENVELFITGSNSRMLSGELATKISGRYVAFEVFTLSFLEYVDFKQNASANRSSYVDYMRTGGLPALFNLQSDEMKGEYVSALISTIMLKDIVARYGVKDVRLLENLFAYMVSAASGLVSVPNIVNYIKSAGIQANYTTVASYVEYLLEAFLLYRVPRCDVRGKRVITGTCKYYANDLAFRNYLYPHYGSGVGYALENLVYLELRRYGYSVSIGAMGGREIDFVAKKSSRIIYVQVAYTVADDATLQREIAPFMRLLPADEKLLVTMDDFALVPSGIKIVPAWELASAII